MSQSDRLSAESHIDLELHIRRRAHEIWLARDRASHSEGSALQDWLQAEREVLGGDGRDSAQRRGATVGDAHAPSDIEEPGEA